MKIEFKGRRDLPGVQVITIDHSPSHVECSVLLNGTEKLRLGLHPEGMCVVMKAAERPTGPVLDAFALALAEHVRQNGATTLEPAADIIAGLPEGHREESTLVTDHAGGVTHYTALTEGAVAALVVTSRRTVSTVLVSTPDYPLAFARAIALTLWDHQRA